MADPLHLVLGMEHQPPMPIEWSDFDPHQWRGEALPDVDLVRPAACPTCLTAAKSGGRVILQGHGKRQREVVVPAVIDEEDEVELLECWVRRYRCTLCRAVVTVLPKGVLPRYLYSAAAMVMAFLLVADRPVGEGLSDADRQRIRDRIQEVRGEIRDARRAAREAREALDRAEWDLYRVRREMIGRYPV